MQQAILVTGGAGYIGSHVCKELLESGNKVIIVDNLSTGRLGAVEYLASQYPNQVFFFRVDLKDKASLDTAFSLGQIDSVVHLAASISVGESNSRPVEYIDNNCIATGNVLEAMATHKVKKIVFSSTAATYGKVEQSQMPLKEEQEAHPNSVYGITKLADEQAIKFAEHLGIGHTIFRFFNVMGADESGELGYNTYPPQHLMQSAVLRALGMNDDFKLTCPSVDTRDHSTIRDYVHVSDIAHAVHLALERHWNGHDEETSETLNLGTEQGQSTLEIIDMVRKQLRVDFPVERGQARPGEDPVLV